MPLRCIYAATRKTCDTYLCVSGFMWSNNLPAVNVSLAPAQMWSPELIWISLSLKTWFVSWPYLLRPSSCLYLWLHNNNNNNNNANNVLAFMWTNVTLNFVQLWNVINVFLRLQFVDSISQEPRCIKNGLLTEIHYKCHEESTFHTKLKLFNCMGGRNLTIQQTLGLYPDNWTWFPLVQSFPALKTWKIIY